MFQKVRIFNPVPKGRVATDLKRKPESFLSPREHKRQTYQAERLSKLPAVEDIECCTKKCISQCFGDQVSAENFRLKYFSFPNDAVRKSWLKDKLLPGVDDNVDSSTKIFTINGYRVCYKLLEQLLGASTSLLTSLKGTPNCKNGPNTFRPSRTSIPFRGKMFTKREHVACWLNLQKAFYDIQPDRDYVALPFAFKVEVYNQYCKETFSSPEFDKTWPRVQKSLFYDVWKKDVKGLKCCRFHRFMVCDTCSTLNQKLLRQSLSQSERNKWADTKDHHLQTVRMDRTLYEARILEAMRMHNNVLSITIDGSDNAKYGFPYFPSKTHSSQKGHKIISKLYGAIVHGRWAATYIYSGNMTGGTNVTIEVLHRILTSLQREGSKFPRKLYLQLDNTVSTNKSKYVKAYLKSLVDTGIFEEIEVHYFQVGHTHCDIDQLFSRIAIYLLDKCIFTFQELLDACKMALSGMDGWMKYTERITHFCNWKSTIEPFLVPVHHFSGITKFRAFRFTKKEGRGILMVKRSILDDGPWHDFSYRTNTAQSITRDDMVLNADWFRNTRFHDYEIPALPVMNGVEREYQQLHISIVNCAQRIKDEVDDDEKANIIIQELEDEIQSWRAEKVCPCSWDFSIYLNPTTVTDEEAAFLSEADLAAIPALARERAEQRLYAMENGLPLDVSEVCQGMMVITEPNDDPFNAPFWLAEVMQTYGDRNDEHYGKIKVCWYAPKVHKSSDIGNLTPMRYLNGGFVTLATIRNSKNNRKGREIQRDNSYMDLIDVESVSYVFNRLTHTQKLPQSMIDILKEDERFPLCS
jgi:hypothetical protein